MNPVMCKEATGWNMSIAQLFGSGPKWTIRCGNCEVDFTARIPMVDQPRVPCPHCRAVNIVPVTVS